MMKTLRNSVIITICYKRERELGDPKGRRGQRSALHRPEPERFGHRMVFRANRQSTSHLSDMHHVSNLVMGSEFRVGKPKYLLKV
jgi:hypothetical protein